MRFSTGGIEYFSLPGEIQRFVSIYWKQKFHNKNQIIPMNDDDDNKTNVNANVNERWKMTTKSHTHKWAPQHTHTHEKKNKYMKKHSVSWHNSIIVDRLLVHKMPFLCTRNMSTAHIFHGYYSMHISMEENKKTKTKNKRNEIIWL